MNCGLNPQTRLCLRAKDDLGNSRLGLHVMRQERLLLFGNPDVRFSDTDLLHNRKGNRALETRPTNHSTIARGRMMKRDVGWNPNNDTHRTI